MSQSTALGGMELGNMARDLSILSALGCRATLAIRVWPELEGWVGKLTRPGLDVTDTALPIFLSTWDRWRVRRLMRLYGMHRFGRLARRILPTHAMCYSSSLTDCLSHLYYARRSRLRSLLSVHAVYAGRSWDRWQAGFIREALSGLAAIRCVSRAAADGFVAAFGEFLPDRLAPTVIYNGIDTQRFRPPTPAERQRARADLALPGEAVVLGSVSRLERQKGVLPLLETFAALAARHPALHLVLAGDGTQRQALEAAATSAGIDRRVRILGHVRDPLPVLQALDIFVSFSRVEGFGFASAEAMAVGLPIVATDVPGTREVVAHGLGGRLFPYQDWQQAARLIDDLLERSDDARALGRGARQRAETCWDVGRRDREMQHFFECGLGVPGAMERLG